jgi:16S rRNA (cytosine1402-N4)-methyltransferase
LEILHKPVLLQDCLQYLNPADGICSGNEFMIDSTLGEGGHSEAFLEKYHSLNIMGLDADPTIQSRARQRLNVYGSRMQFFNGWFNDFYAAYPETIPHPDIILFDLGISVYHYEKSGRGFSFRYDEPLDMRLNTEEKTTAADIVNTMDESDLADLIFRYGEERYSRRIAKAIITARLGRKIVSSKDLADIIYESVPAAYRYGRIHPATRTFQALRIAVNSELRRLPKALHDAFSVLNIKGKMGVITFHSLEDRIVKNYFRNLAKKCVCPPEFPKCVCGGEPCAELLTRKPVLPSPEEIAMNSPSRSAKLRVVRKLKDASVRDRLHISGEGV